MPLQVKPADGINREVLIDKKEIAKRVKLLGKEISKDYIGKQPLFIGILKGSFIFLADLVRELDPNLEAEIDFMKVSSYEGTESTRKPKIDLDLNKDITGRHVIVVEDIVDTGYSFRTLLAILSVRNPASLRTCSLVSKPSRREVEVPIDYVGFTIDNKWIEGYGLDTDQKYRTLPSIWARKSV